MSSNFITWPAPAGEAPSADYTLEVDGQPVLVYAAKVRQELLKKDGLWSHLPDCPSERAAFAMFDMAGPVTVTVRPARPFATATVVPVRAGIAADVQAGEVRFKLDRPRHLTVLLDDCTGPALHLFIGLPETDIPRQGDPNVIYFGPGIHEIQRLSVATGQTVYLAGGAIVKAATRPGDPGRYNENLKITFRDGGGLNVHNVKGVRVCGRGILDGSLVPHPGQNLIGIVNSQDVRLEGIVLRDTPNWNVIISQSQHVRVDDLRIISGRLNSDGINSVSSRDVQIRRCFVRNLDDSIVVKTLEPNAPAEDITVEDCVLWSDWGYSLGVSYETRSPIHRVSFRRCDIIYARHWCMGVRVCDSATISDITFGDIEVGDLTPATRLAGAYDAIGRLPKLVSLTIVKDMWGKDDQRGRVRNIVVDGVTVHGPLTPTSEIAGVDEDHDVRGVLLKNIRLAGNPPADSAEALGLKCNAFVRDARVEA